MHVGLKTHILGLFSLQVEGIRTQ